ncbi:MAG: hypothetical protein ABH971_01880 [bacterium]
MEDRKKSCEHYEKKDCGLCSEGKVSCCFDCKIAIKANFKIREIIKECKLPRAICFFIMETSC